MATMATNDSMSLNEAYKIVTGLVGYNVEEMIQSASEEEKAQLYNRLSWFIPRGRYLDNEESDIYKAYSLVLEDLTSEMNFNLDVNEDGVVDEEDLDIVKSNVGKTPSETVKGDVNEDSKIDETDVQMVEEQVKTKKKFTLTYKDTEGNVLEGEDYAPKKYTKNKWVSVAPVPEVEGMNGSWEDEEGSTIEYGNNIQMTSDKVLTEHYESAGQPSNEV